MTNVDKLLNKKKKIMALKADIQRGEGREEELLSTLEEITGHDNVSNAIKEKNKIQSKFKKIKELIFKKETALEKNYEWD